MINHDTVRRSVISGGVRNLREFGYPTVDESTIFTDYIFAAFFDKMLEENLETLPVSSTTKMIRDVLTTLREEIKEKRSKTVDARDN